MININIDCEEQTKLSWRPLSLLLTGCLACTATAGPGFKIRDRSSLLQGLKFSRHSEYYTYKLIHFPLKQATTSWLVSLDELQQTK